MAASLPKVLNGGKFQVKPASILYTGDGTGFFAGRKKADNHSGRLNWTSWTSTGGRGSGFNWLDNCQPSCAAGTFHQYPVKLHVWRPEHVGGHLIFTRMTVRYTGTRPSGVAQKQVFKVTHSGGTFSWMFPPQ
jgi:hypothetical protein